MKPPWPETLKGIGLLKFAISICKIFIKEALEWDGLPKPVRLIFSNIYQIVKLHQNLLEVRRCQWQIFRMAKY